MDPEPDNTKTADSDVKELQENLFQIAKKPKPFSQPGGFFMNLVFKQHPQVDEAEIQDVFARQEPREIFTIIKEPASTMQGARWPTECQVLDEKIKHISYTPSAPEPYYVQSGKEPQPKPVGDEFGMIIYQYYPISAVSYFSKSNVGGSRYLLPTCPSPEEDSLRFESRFESGNLAKAIKITANYYELHLRTDLYTNKHMQWFYFRVTNMKKNFLYRFSIVNMTKDGSLYNEGMKPLLYSNKDSQLHSIGWRRCGKNIIYYCNDNGGTEDPETVITYTLTFTLEFPHDDDIVYLAYGYPYTYTDLQDYLIDLCKHPVKSTFTTLRLLCKTLAGNNIYYLTVTTPLEPYESKKKKAIIITARVHPSETPASWMMKGILDFITGDSGPAKELRDKFIFKVVPMLNPDGVIVGNTRCSLAGKDLNRQYRTVMRELFPSIWYTKLMIRRMIEECGVAMYCDLHAHSRRHNIFIYGCESKKGSESQLCEQVFPLMLHKNAADKFSFEYCKFRVQRCKEGTGRVVMWMMGIANSYTMEASLSGSLLGTRAETHFSVQDYEQMGRSFCQTLLDFYDNDPRKGRLRGKIIERLLMEGSNADEPTNIRLSDYSSDAGDTSDSSSDEVGREEYPISLIVPPPSPDVNKKYSGKPKSTQNKLKLRPSNTGLQERKTLPLFRTNIDLNLLQKNSKYGSSYSSSDSDFDSSDSQQKKKITRKRRTLRRTKKKKQLSNQKNVQKHRSPSRGYSLIEIVSEEKYRSHSWHRSATLPVKSALEAKKSQTITQQLSEVQSKLKSLRNRLWFGTGDYDPDQPVKPLSWGTSKDSDNLVVDVQKSEDKKPVKKSDEKKFKKKSKVKEQTKEKNKKKQNGLKRQTAVEWAPELDLNIVRKSRSLPDISINKNKNQSNPTQGCEPAKIKVKKKKKKNKN